MATQTNRPGFTVYFNDWEPILEELDGACFKAVFVATFGYARTGESAVLNDPSANMAFLMLRPRLAADAEKYAKHVEDARRGGRKNANARQQASTVVDSCQQKQPIESPTESPIESRIEFLSPKPSLVDIAAEAQRAGLQVDAAQFLADCEADGWRDGRGEPIRDWKKWLRGYAALKHAGAKVPPPASDYEQRCYNLGELAARTESNFEAAAAALEGGDNS